MNDSRAFIRMVQTTRGTTMSEVRPTVTPTVDLGARARAYRDQRLNRIRPFPDLFKMDPALPIRMQVNQWVEDVREWIIEYGTRELRKWLES